MLEAVDVALDFEVNSIVAHEGVEVVLINEFLRDVGEFDADILWTVEGCLEIEGFHVEGEEIGTFAGEHTVEDQFDQVEGSYLGTGIAGIYNVVTCNCNTWAIGIAFVWAKGTHNFRIGNGFAGIGGNIVVLEPISKLMMVVGVAKRCRRYPWLTRVTGGCQE